VQHYGYTHEEFLQDDADGLARAGGDAGKQHVREANMSGLIWRHRRKDGTAMDMEVVWSPLAFHGKLAALTMATDVTVRRRAGLHNALFGKLSHQLSAVTTASEAALFICEAADELFRWDDLRWIFIRRKRTRWFRCCRSRRSTGNGWRYPGRRSRSTRTRSCGA